MASLHFHYAAMNSGKSSHLLQVAFNYKERGMNSIILKPAVDTRDGSTVSSRIGISAKAHMISRDDSLKAIIDRESEINGNHCVLVDEAQFLTIDQVKHLAILSIVWKFLSCVTDCCLIELLLVPRLIPASRFSRRKGRTQENCWCGKKATMTMRIDEHGKKIWGPRVSIGGNDQYISVCRKHWNMGKSSK
ncbi:thymidine kinase [Aeromonas phage 25]|uniref:Thymidine kinase n=1 Tax=Aeromonas phage 25 TaxID=2911441 RepID=Q19CS7_9CAUD|nr:thymidine kinase [Aeromonas phage 25]ABF72648.1 thymidine kinase [Aeromonas phage 25]